jgi:NAD(P)-dependent dehydrogenase (short-subunit alcohol dehydrogenase family)
MRKKSCLVIGASGSIGSAVSSQFSENGYEVWHSSRTESSSGGQVVQLVGDPSKDQNQLRDAPMFDAIVWAQGANANDNINDFNYENFLEIVKANVGFILTTMSVLLAEKKVASGSRLCIVSSIWQDAIRPNKLSYSITKSALNGLVQSAAVDLAPRGILVNAVLPGVLDTPMTRSVLSSEQISSVANRTGFNRLVSCQEIATLCYFLCSEANTMISGQSVVADLGFSNVRPI